MYFSSNIPKTLNPHPLLLPPFHSSKSPFQFLHLKPISRPNTPKPFSVRYQFHQIPNVPSSSRRDVRSFAGRSKGKPGGTSGGRIEGDAELRRDAKRNARRKAQKYAESLFYRVKNPHKNYPDNFTEEELQMIGLGYDRMVRFMDKDDPNLKHPHDWYKYGQFGPYSWKGVVLGDPIRGRLSDECVTMIGEVRDQEEWEKIEQHDMAVDYQKKLDTMDSSKEIKYFWVFVRHPKWTVTEKPWQQWTLVSEVAVEAGKERLDKWLLMGRLGNKTRSNITQCAAWMRPDIIYVKRPVYQCRFEPQADFFGVLAPLLDPETEGDYPCELEGDDGSVEMCTYFGGLCKILRVNPKAFVDDVVKGYEKLSEEKKSKCLEFLFNNHPVLLLHPFTKEWKAKLEEMELGCDAPDDDDDNERVGKDGENDIVDWVEDDGNEEGSDADISDEFDDDDVAFDGEEGGDEVLGIKEDDEDRSPEENEKYWEEEFKKALKSNEGMEKLVRKSIETTNKFYDKQLQTTQKGESSEGGDELEFRGKRAKISPQEWKRLGYGPYRKRLSKSKAPPGLFLRAAVRPFTYRNLIKEIVLTRHGIVDGDIRSKK